MTIEEMKARKVELGYTNEKVADLSGVPLGTVQKIFAGETKSPRYDTIQKLTKLLEDTGDADHHIPQKKRFGIANGKYKIPPDEMFYDDEITEMFEDI